MNSKTDSTIWVLLVAMIFCFIRLSVSADDIFPLDSTPTPELKVEDVEVDYYDTCINYLKKYETFAPKRYFCGCELIGYGHQITKLDNLPQEISEKQADSLLRRDFDKSKNFVAKNTNLTGNKLLAISCFVFNVGSTAFMNSTLRKKIEAGQEIKQEILKWNKMMHNGEMVSSSSLSKRRIWEFELYSIDH